MQEDEPTSFVKYEKFESVMLVLMESGQYAPDTEETLLRAFRVFDPDNSGYVDPERLRQLLTEEGVHPFREKEVEGALDGKGVFG